jgi:hypothetical protein
MDKFLKSFTTGKGDKVEMNILEGILYTLLPVIGQPLMRINKFGGSLDKPYLFFPLLLIPPFSAIPTLFAYFGLIDKIEDSNPLDIYIIIPTICKLILIFFAIELGSSRGMLLQNLILLGAIMLTNALHMLTQAYCKDIPATTTGSKLGKIFMDSMLQYGLGVLLLLALNYIPYIGSILNKFKDTEGILGDIYDIVSFGISVAFAYIIVNMIDVNYIEKTDACNGNISVLRGSISIIIFAIGMFIQLRSNIGGIINGDADEEEE